MTRLTAFVLLMISIAPLEAGLLRHKQTAASQQKSRQKKSKAKWGMTREQHQKILAKNRKRPHSKVKMAQPARKKVGDKAS